MKTLLVDPPSKGLCSEQDTGRAEEARRPLQSPQDTESRVVSATLSARATPTALVSRSEQWDRPRDRVCGVIPAKANTSPDRKVVPYERPPHALLLATEMGGFLSVIRLRVRASPREPLSYRMGEGQGEGSKAATSQSAVEPLFL